MPGKSQRTVTSARRAPLEICLVTRDFLGFSRTTEAAAAMVGLAQAMAAAGDNVTVLFVAAKDNLVGSDPVRLERLTDYYRNTFLINVELLRGSPELLPDLSINEKASLAVYHYLKRNRFDVAYFALPGGLAHYTVLARETACFPDAPKIVTLVQSPLLWQGEADRFFLRSVEEIAQSHMEQRSAEGSDLLVFSNAAMEDWARNAGWRLPAKIERLPNLRPLEAATNENPLIAEAGSRPIEEIVFFGDGDFHRGLGLFCSTIDQVADELSARGVRISFIGEFGRIQGEHTASFVLRKARNWQSPVAFHPRMDLSGAANYLARRPCLTIAPFLAADTPLAVATCLEEGVPIIATSVGGIPEMFAVEERGRSLCEPNAKALAALVRSALKKNPGAARPALSAEAKVVAWRKHLARLADEVTAPPPKRQSGKRKSRPLVSVIMAHHDRPDLVKQAIASVKAQDYPNLEVVLVDDGSSTPAAKALLDRLEPEFAEAGWTIIRQENRYLGAARNAGIRRAKGEYILFLDDDNVLFDRAVTTLMRAMEHSGADVCTCLAKRLHEKFVPPDEKLGFIHYVPLGGSVELAFIHDTYGDANALFRAEVFKKIGYLVEDYGFVSQDWEFFTRASLAGLKVRVVPEALYWYRASPEGMYNSSNWYNTRQVMLRTFAKSGFKDLSMLQHLILSQNVAMGDQENFHHNLQYQRANEKLYRLRDHDPNSDQAFEILAEVAATEGRPDTAMGLLAQTRRQAELRSALTKQIEKARGEAAETDPLVSRFLSEATLGRAELSEVGVSSLPPGTTRAVSYLGDNGQIFLEAVRGSTTIATMVAAGGRETFAASATVAIEQEMAGAIEVRMLLADGLRDIASAAGEDADPEAIKADTGWFSLSAAYNRHELTARVKEPVDGPLNLLLMTRPTKRSRPEGPSFASFSAIRLTRTVEGEYRRHPRKVAPPKTRPAYALSKEQLRSAVLVSNYKSPYPLLAQLGEEEGIFLRPSIEGVVAARLPWVFPPFCRKVIGQVEIADELSSPFEFAMALTRPDEPVVWTRERPDGSLAFSGWVRVREKFQIREIEVTLRELTRMHLDLTIGIRLPPKSSPLPSRSIWRKFVLVWDA